MPEGVQKKRNQQHQQKAVSDRTKQGLSADQSRTYAEIAQFYDKHGGYTRKFVTDHCKAKNFCNAKGLRTSIAVYKFHELMCDLSHYAIDVPVQLLKLKELVEKIPAKCPTKKDEDAMDEDADEIPDLDTYEKAVATFKEALFDHITYQKVWNGQHTRGNLIFDSKNDRE